MPLSSKTQVRPSATREATVLSTKTRTRDAAPWPVHPVLGLQEAIGNQATLSLLQSGLIQPKLRVGAPDDAYEREADRVADQVMRMPDPTAPPAPQLETAAPTHLQRMCPKCEEELQRQPQETFPVARIISPRIQRLCPECDEELQRQPVEEEDEEEAEIQRKAVPGSAPLVTPQTQQQIRASQGRGRPLPPAERAFFEPRFGRDFSDVRLNTGATATVAAHEINARAFTIGRDIMFSAGEYAPNTSRGRRLLGHELTHVVQQTPTVTRGKLNPSKPANLNPLAYASSSVDRGVPSSSARIQRKTQGEETFDKSQAHLALDTDIKTHVDVLKAALREIRKGKSTGFNENAGLDRIDQLGSLLGFDATKIASLKTDWQWIIKNRAATDYQSRKTAFFGAFTSPINELSKQRPKSQAKYWLRNAPANVFDVVHDVANATISAEELFAFAANEGLVDVYIRPQTGVAQGNPTSSQLGNVKTTESVSGFDAFGLDDFMTDMTATRQPLTNFQPAGFDTTRLTPETRTNEKLRTVSSVKFPDLKMALQGLVMMMSRRRALFVEDAKALGYGAPSTELLVYFTYLYFNPGEFAGKKTLRDNQGKRKLEDWPKTRFFADAKKVLDSYRMIVALKIF